MTRVLLGLFLGVSVATGVSVFAQTYPSHSTSPYAPGSFMSETATVNKMLDNSTDSYLRSQYRDPDPWPTIGGSPCPR